MCEFFFAAVEFVVFGTSGLTFFPVQRVSAKNAFVAVVKPHLHTTRRDCGIVVTQMEKQRGKVYVTRKFNVHTGDAFKDVLRVDCTSGSTTKVEGLSCHKLSPFHLGPVREVDVFPDVEFQHVRDLTALPDSRLPEPMRAQNVENYWQYGKIFSELGHAPRNAEWQRFRQNGYKKKTADRHPEGTVTKKKNGGKVRTRYRKATSSMYMNVEMGYVESRKKIYAPVYAYYAKRTEVFERLKELVNAGTSVMIVDYDILPTKEAYEVTTEFLTERINDPQHPFGHGYVLAGLLAGIRPSQYCGITPSETD